MKKKKIKALVLSALVFVGILWLFWGGNWLYNNYPHILDGVITFGIPVVISALTTFGVYILYYNSYD